MKKIFLTLMLLCFCSVVSAAAVIPPLPPGVEPCEWVKFGHYIPDDQTYYVCSKHFEYKGSAERWDRLTFHIKVVEGNGDVFMRTDSAGRDTYSMSDNIVYAADGYIRYMPHLDRVEKVADLEENSLGSNLAGFALHLYSTRSPS